MTFAAPFWLFVAVALILAGSLGLRVAEARRRRALERFVAGPLLSALTATSSARRRLAKGGLLLAALGLGCVALARPSLGWRAEEVHHRGTDVLFAVDVSRSMLAQDVKPDRLSRAKLAVIDLLGKLEGDRVGLIAFAGSAFLQSPLTGDHAAFRQSLEALDTDVIPRGGTDVGAALHQAEEAFRTAGAGQKLLVLVSDGEDLEGNARVAAEEAAKQGITVYTVGVGTAAGERIALDRVGGRGVVLDPSGEPVTSKLDEAGLQAVAEATGGFYVALGARGEGLDTIYARVLADAPKQEYAARMQRVPIGRFQWPLGLALALVVGEALLRERRRSPSVSPAPRALRAVAAATALLLASLLAGSASASPREAEKAYAAGAYDEALGHYRDAAEAAPDDARLRFNQGVAAYRAGKHDQAAEAFSKALESSDVALQQRAYYDLGNARFRLAEAAAKSGPEQAQRALEESVKAYDGALALDPKDENARFNRDLAKARLEALAQEQAKKQAQDSKQQEPQQPSDGKDPQQPSDGKDPQQSNEGKNPQPSNEGKNPQPSNEGKGQQQAQAGKDPQQANDGKDGQGQQAQQAGPGGEKAQQAGAGEQGHDPAAGEQPQDAGQGQKAEPGQRRDAAQGQGAGAPKRDGTPERADGKPGGDAPLASGREARPGEMSAQDAAGLLDSLRGDEMQAPRAAAKRGGAGSDNDEPTRNW